MTIFIVLLIPLLVLAVFSLRFAFSGDLEGRLVKGWILLIAVWALTYELVASWMATHPDPFNRLAAGLVGALLFGSQTPLLIALITHTFMAGRSRGLKVLKVHSEAERLVTEEDLPGAIREYVRIVTEDPEDVDAWSRLADLCYQNGSYRKAAKAYERVLEHAHEFGPDRHCSVLTRLADIRANQLGDVAGARGLIETIIREYPETKYARFARSRLDNL